MNPMASFSTNTSGMTSSAEVHNVNGAHITYNYNGPVHFHGCCNIPGCPNYTSIAAPDSVTSDPWTGISNDAAGRLMDDGRAVSSPGTSTMEAPIAPPHPSTPARKAGRIATYAKRILTRLVRALS
ncbi:hypothetical protein FIBSPDRAFT_876836 [Athelia psychrophila]|uniref:Uncharacterized protein n=1 Tax=Athelia psychrophila TaxID=1759441 RepID=A0A167WGZ2_9AGAM|nr:hypothetical protein FIBSPDRAFT_876836 [Fibularhizoctonia sp. CBS 109695]